MKNCGIKSENLITPISNKSDICDEKYMNIKFNSDDDCALKKTLELQNMVIVLRSAFHETNKYSLQVFLD